MKRVLRLSALFILITFFLIFNGGLFYNVHDCQMMQTSKVSLISTESNCCGEDEIKPNLYEDDNSGGCCATVVQVPKSKTKYGKKPCCSDKHVFIKLTEDFYCSLYNLAPNIQSSTVFFVSSYLDQISFIGGIRNIFFFANGPPGIFFKGNLFTYFCQFLV